MAMEHEQWKAILSAIDYEVDLSKDNVIEKVKEKLIDSSAYKEWERTYFDVNFLFQVGNIQCALLRLVACSNLGNVAGALLKIEGINVNVKWKNGWTPLHLAAGNGHKEIVDALLAKKADVNAKEENDRTPLHLAAGNDHKEIVDVLLAKKADVNAKEKNGWTPLHLAAGNGHKKIVDALLAKKADVNAKEENGWTPLHFATRNGCTEVVKILIANGADPLLKNKDGKTPRDLEEKQPTSAVAKGIFAGCSTALLGAAIAVTLFATGTVAVELMSMMIAAAIVTAAALAVGGITYSILKPSTKMDETKEAQNVNGNVLGGGKAAA